MHDDCRHRAQRLLYRALPRRALGRAWSPTENGSHLLMCPRVWVAHVPVPQGSGHSSRFPSLAMETVVLGVPLLGLAVLAGLIFRVRFGHDEGRWTVTCLLLFPVLAAVLVVLPALDYELRQ